MSNIVDFHTHILPRMDDGSNSSECSLAMLRAEYEQGIRRVVLTPHFYADHDSPKRFLERRDASEKRLLEVADGVTDLPKIYVGAEVHYFDGMSDSEHIRDLAIRGTDHVLVEMPMSRWSDRMLRELEDIYQKCKLTPIIAHVDRYVTPLGVKGPFERLADLPVKVQVNSSFFLNVFSRKNALKLLADKKIHLLGSDCHNMGNRAPDLDKALRFIRRKLGEDAVAYINSQENKIIPVEE